MIKLFFNNPIIALLHGITSNLANRCDSLLCKLSPVETFSLRISLESLACVAQNELPVLVARDPTHAVSNFKISIAKGQVAKTVCGAGQFSTIN